MWGPLPSEHDELQLMFSMQPKKSIQQTKFQRQAQTKSFVQANKSFIYRRPSS